MVERLRNREEWILAAIISISSVVVGGAVAASFGATEDSSNIVLAILGFGGTVLSGLFAALKADKAEATIKTQIESLPRVSRLTNTNEPETEA